MNAKIKARWLKALRSGRYKQAKEQLRTGFQPGPYSYCCLGVLCDLARKSGIGEWDDGKFNGHAGDLPEVVVDWAGLESSNPEVMTRAGIDYLANLNDGGRTFKQIANYIEKSL